MQIAEPAAAKLHQLLAGQAAVGGSAFRLLEADTRQITIWVGTCHEGDTEFRHDGQPVLYVPQTLARRLHDTVVELGEVQDELCLLIRKQNARGTAGIQSGDAPDHSSEHQFRKSRCSSSMSAHSTGWRDASRHGRNAATLMQSSGLWGRCARGVGTIDVDAAD
ncbi:MAG: hypothetical protein WD208_02360 [Dehalococcoidia bacterium]